MPAPSIDELLDRKRSSHLSHSRINRYLTCPEQYRLYYIERLRPKIDTARLVFGTAIHIAIADFFRTGEDPVEHFRRDWENLKTAKLRYNKRESWEDFNSKGRKLLQQFVDVEAPKIRKTLGVERKFELWLPALNRPFLGSIDLVAQMDDRMTIVDFKTATSDYEDHEAVLSDQLTAYMLAEPEAEQVALCVLVKTKEPRIEWHFAKREIGDLAEYVDKVQLVAGDIAAAKFYKRPGKQCSYCDFLPGCLGDRKTAQETLVKIN